MTGILARPGLLRGRQDRRSLQCAGFLVRIACLFSVLPRSWAPGPRSGGYPCLYPTDIGLREISGLLRALQERRPKCCQPPCRGKGRGRFYPPSVLFRNFVAARNCSPPAPLLEPEAVTMQCPHCSKSTKYPLSADGAESSPRHGGPGHAQNAHLAPSRSPHLRVRGKPHRARNSLPGVRNGRDSSGGGSRPPPACTEKSGWQSR